MQDLPIIALHFAVSRTDRSEHEHGKSGLKPTGWKIYHNESYEFNSAKSHIQAVAAYYILKIIRTV